jgi:triosephosphate isomerase
MRRRVFAANWKMNLVPDEARTLAGEIRRRLDADAGNSAGDREVIIAPAFVALAAVAEAIAQSRIALAAQNMHYAERGAFTGEVSAPMLAAVGVTHVILGHSERRHILGESEDFISRKVEAAIAHRLVPILCVGETREEHDAGRAVEVILRQLHYGFSRLEAGPAARAVVAYEPVWAIGTGRNATPGQAQQAHGAIRASLRDRFGAETAAAVRIIYGGSVNPGNIEALMAQRDVDGVLVGGASLEAESFVRIARAGDNL